MPAVLLRVVILRARGWAAVLLARPTSPWGDRSMMKMRAIATAAARSQR
jgi:hypothetical protein